jgi:hypothetical protein
MAGLDRAIQAQLLKPPQYRYTPLGRIKADAEVT